MDPIPPQTQISEIPVTAASPEVNAQGAPLSTAENPSFKPTAEEIRLREETLSYFNGGLVGLNGEPLTGEVRNTKLKGFLTESIGLMAAEIGKAQAGQKLDTTLIGKARLLHILSSNALQPQSAAVQAPQFSQSVAA